ncbi:MAG: alpha-galactosidase, partial [Rhabdochlamydiaceae bacterium]
MITPPIVAAQAASSLPTNQIAPNRLATVRYTDSGRIYIRYHGNLIFEGKIFGIPKTNLKSIKVISQIQSGPNRSKTQTIFITSPKANLVMTLQGTVFASSEAFANQSARIPGAFEFIRNEVGPSHNWLNNSVYDRFRDWLLSGPLTQTRIAPIEMGAKKSKWNFSAKGKGAIQVQFLPAMYRRHKNIPYFQPWTYSPWKGSITGWCSWWAYRDAITEADVQEIDRVFDKNLKDYGYKYIQIDDGYESGLGGTLKEWLQTNSKFPSGLAGLENEISSHGLEPGIWINVHFNDPQTLKDHPDWFIQDAPGHPHNGPWIENALNPSNEGADQNIIVPHLKALRDQGWKYVKIDTLRHFLYDCMYPSRTYLKTQGETPEH